MTQEILQSVGVTASRYRTHGSESMNNKVQSSYVGSSLYDSVIHLIEFLIVQLKDVFRSYLGIGPYQLKSEKKRITMSQLEKMLVNFPEKDAIMNGIDASELPEEVEYTPCSFVELVKDCLPEGLVHEFTQTAMEALRSNSVKKVDFGQEMISYSVLIDHSIHTVNVEKWKDGEVLVASCNNYKYKKTCACCFAVALKEERPELISNRFKNADKYSLKNLITPNKHNKKPGRKTLKKRRSRARNMLATKSQSYKKGVTLEDKAKEANMLRKKRRASRNKDESKKQKGTVSNDSTHESDSSEFSNETLNQNEEENQKCIVCDSGGTIVLCDSCNTGYHPRCHKPRFKVSQIPEGAWYCSKCKSKK